MRTTFYSAMAKLAFGGTRVVLHGQLTYSGPLMHIKQMLALCQNVSIMHILMTLIPFYHNE